VALKKKKKKKRITPGEAKARADSLGLQRLRAAVGIPAVRQKGPHSPRGMTVASVYWFEVLVLVKVQDIIWENNSKDGYFVPSKSHGDLTGATSPAGVLDF
jgi:hypothetical protein